LSSVKYGDIIILKCKSNSKANNHGGLAINCRPSLWGAATLNKSLTRAQRLQSYDRRRCRDL